MCSFTREKVRIELFVIIFHGECCIANVSPPAAVSEAELRDLHIAPIGEVGAGSAG